VPEDQAATCIADLQQMGYETACVIGRVTEHVDDQADQEGDCDLHGGRFNNAKMLTAPLVHACAALIAMTNYLSQIVIRL